MNQSSHTGQKMKNRRMLLLLWFYSEKTSFSHLAHPISLLPLDHLGFFYSIVFFFSAHVQSQTSVMLTSVM